MCKCTWEDKKICSCDSKPLIDWAKPLEPCTGMSGLKASAVMRYVGAIRAIHGHIVAYSYGDGAAECLMRVNEYGQGEHTGAPICQNTRPPTKKYAVITVQKADGSCYSYTYGRDTVSLSQCKASALQVGQSFGAKIVNVSEFEAP